MTNRRAIVHIGLEKTGTTSIQTFLHQNRFQLERQGFYVPTTIGTPNHVAITCLAMNEQPHFPTVWNILGIRDIEQLRTFVKTTAEALRRELKCLPQTIHTVLISNEHIHSNIIDIQEVANLKRIIGDLFEHAAILVYLRRQDQLAASLFSTRIKGGGPWEKAVFPIIKGPPPHYFDFRKILKQFSDAFGFKNVWPRIYQREKLVGHDIVLDYCDTVGIKINDSFVMPPSLNEAISPAALYVLSFLNKDVPCFVNGSFNRQRDYLVEILEQTFPSTERLGVRADAQQFYSAFIDDNENLRREFMPHCQKPLFSLDFLQYSDLPRPQPSIIECAKVFAVLWNGLSAIRVGLQTELDEIARSK